MVRIQTILAAGLLCGATICHGAIDLDELEPCALAMPGTLLTAEAHCGTLEVPENPDQPDGRRIELRFAVSPAVVENPEPDPVVYFAGGPGQAATEVWPMLQPIFRNINRRRDIILLDQRGTGGSHPLDCNYGEIEELVMPSAEETRQLAVDCLAELDADPRFYTTAHGADDMDRLRERLGYDKLNLIGGSYGTRMAQVYQRRHPEHVRSMILDGVVPPRLLLGLEHAPMLDRALERIIADCNAAPDCREAFPDLDNALGELIADYGDDPVRLNVTDPRTGRGREIPFNRDVLAVGIRFLAYAPESQALLPYLIHEAATTGDPTRLASQALMLAGDMDQMLSRGMELSVICSEDAPLWPDAIDQSDTLMGKAIVEFLSLQCDVWPRGQVAPDFHQPVTSDIPVLLLSGERDPVTPPVYGDEAAEQFPNSRHLVMKGQGHIVLRPGCVADIAADFIASASVDDLDTECTARIDAPPFFLDLLGPAP